MIYVYLCIYATQIIQRQERQIQSLWFGTGIHIPDNLLVPFTGYKKALRGLRKKNLFPWKSVLLRCTYLGTESRYFLAKSLLLQHVFLMWFLFCALIFFSVVVIEGGEKRVHWKEGAKRERGSAEQTSSQSFKEEGWADSLLTNHILQIYIVSLR